MHDEPAPSLDAEPLLRSVIRDGCLVEPHPILAAIRERCTAQVAAMPEALRRLKPADTYSVRYSERSVALQRAVRAQVATLQGAT